MPKSPVQLYSLAAIMCSRVRLSHSSVCIGHQVCASFHFGQTWHCQQRILLCAQYLMCMPSPLNIKRTHPRDGPLGVALHLGICRVHRRCMASNRMDNTYCGTSHSFRRLRQWRKWLRSVCSALGRRWCGLAVDQAPMSQQWSHDATTSSEDPPSRTWPAQMRH